MRVSSLQVQFHSSHCDQRCFQANKDIRLTLFWSGYKFIQMLGYMLLFILIFSCVFETRASMADCLSQSGIPPCETAVKELLVYDLDSLIYLSTSLIEGEVIDLDKDSSIATIKINKVIYGDIAQESLINISLNDYKIDKLSHVIIFIDDKVKSFASGFDQNKFKSNVISGIFLVDNDNLVHFPIVNSDKYIYPYFNIKIKKYTIVLRDFPKLYNFENRITSRLHYIGSLKLLFPENTSINNSENVRRVLNERKEITKDDYFHGIDLISEDIRSRINPLDP